jgi:hypothetical protein
MITRVIRPDRADPGLPARGQEILERRRTSRDWPWRDLEQPKHDRLNPITSSTVTVVE